jgi:hypothetical protein
MIFMLRLHVEKVVPWLPRPIHLNGDYEPAVA